MASFGSAKTVVRTVYGNSKGFEVNDMGYDTRCYFNVRSKADINQLYLPHGTDN